MEEHRPTVLDKLMAQQVRQIPQSFRDGAREFEEKMRKSREKEKHAARMQRLCIILMLVSLMLFGIAAGSYCRRLHEAAKKDSAAQK